MCCSDKQAVEIIDEGVWCENDIDVARTGWGMVAQHGTHLPGIRHIAPQQCFAGNSQGQSRKLQQRKPVFQELKNDIYSAGLDITNCYPLELNLTKVKRTIWLIETDLIVVADCVKGEVVSSITYHWHGD